MKNIYVGNLSFETTEDSLETAFAAYGTVRSVSVIRDRHTGQSRGFAFVEMTNDQEAMNAISGMEGTELDGRSVTVNEARPREDRSGGQGRRDSGGRGGGRHERRW